LQIVYRAALGRHRQIVARLEQVMHERPEEMLSAADLCASVGVAQRTLNLACQEFLGQGAMQYAPARRLDHVRDTLLMSDPGETFVTGVAMRFGFWELGRSTGHCSESPRRQRYGSRAIEKTSAGFARVRICIANQTSLDSPAS